MAKRISSLPKAEPRIVKVDGSALGIVTYDVDNGYPQRMKSLINACSTAKQSCSLLSDYTVGQGFDSQSGDFYKAIINEDENKPLTPDLLLRLSSDDRSKFRGHALHVNYNALYQISSINYVNFEDVRIGYKENAGKYCIHADWYNDGGNFGGYRRKQDVVVLHPFNPKPDIIEAQVLEAGGWENYKGQLYYFSEDYNTYPLSSIDEVLESVETEIESDKTTKNNLKNNFQLKAIWVEKGKFEDDRERAEHNEEVKKFIGPDGNPVCVVESEDPDGKDIPEIKTFASSINDKLFAYSDEKARSKIYRAFRQPAILHSDYMGTNGYNKDQLRDSMEYYTNYTHPNRIYFEELFSNLFDNFHIDINPSKIYSIVPLKSLSNEATQTDGSTNI